MCRLTIQPGLKHLVTPTGNPGSFYAKMSDLGVMIAPLEIEYAGLVYRGPYVERDAEGDILSVEYTAGERVFTFWNY